MNDEERKTGIDNGNRSYTARSFITTDARQMAFDNYESLVFSQSGLTGAIPYMGMAAYSQPRGFGYSLQKNGIGGTPSPNARGDMEPLVNQGDFSSTFIRNILGG